MRRILIFGNSASGKSTLAKRLSANEGLAHLDLDSLAWKPIHPPQRMSLEISHREIEKFIRFHEGWIIEGCYTDLLELVVPHASEITFMDLPIDLCVANAKSRPWEPHKYESKEAQDKNLNMLIEWIKAYDQHDDVFSKAAHIKFYSDYAGKKTRITDNR